MSCGIVTKVDVFLKAFYPNKPGQPDGWGVCNRTGGLDFKGYT